MIKRTRPGAGTMTGSAARSNFFNQNDGKQTERPTQVSFNRNAEYRAVVTEEGQLQVGKQESDGSYAGGQILKSSPIKSETTSTFGGANSQIGGGPPGGVQSSSGRGESNFVTLSANSQGASKGNVLVTREKNPYAVTLHNVDKFEQLTQVKARKSKRNDERCEGVIPSEEYINNLSQSFDFADVPQSRWVPSNKRASSNPRKEDNSILYAKMQSTKLWQMSSQYKSL